MSDVIWTDEPHFDFIDRLGVMEFLSDQMFSLDDTLQPAFGLEAWRNQYKAAYLPYVI